MQGALSVQYHNRRDPGKRKHVAPVSFQIASNRNGDPPSPGSFFPAAFLPVIGGPEPAGIPQCLPQQVVDLSVDAAQFVVGPAPQGIQDSRIGTQ